ncbi:MAG: hypothetical protein V9G10_03990 [Candidatus Nanopelagicales bacterium]
MSTDLKPLDASTPRVQGTSVRLGDRIFRNLTRGAGIFVLVLMAAIGAFLVWKAIPAFQNNSGNFFTTQEWFPDAKPPVFGIAALAFGTAISSIMAMVIALPIAIGTALFIAYYANRRISIQPRLRHRRPGSGPVDHLRPVGPGSPDDPHGRHHAVAQRLPRLHPAVQATTSASTPRASSSPRSCWPS